MKKTLLLIIYCSFFLFVSIFDCCILYVHLCKYRKSVRLGEYNIETEEDCMPSNTENGQILKCADQVVELGVEKIIVHQQYNDKSKNKHHDIALLRLNADVTYSKYIKPICLPVEDLNSGLIVGSKLTVSGWGRTNGIAIFVYIYKISILIAQFNGNILLYFQLITHSN